MPPKKKQTVVTAQREFRGDDIMIDLETLSTDVDGAIMSIGACRFNEEDIADDGFYRIITVQSNLDEHRTISPSTLSWWMTQSKEAQAIFSSPDAVPLGQALDELRAWIGSHTANIRPWGNGADFDISMLKHAYGRQATPWAFYNVRCFRTLKSTPAAKAIPKVEPLIAHHALHDAIAQAKHLQLLWKAGIGK